MISKEEFIKLLNEYSEFSIMENKVEEIFKCEFFESPIVEIPWKWFERLLDIYIKPEFRDLVSDYIWPSDVNFNLWDRAEHPLYLYFIEDENKVENVIATFEDLYNYLKANDGFNTNC